MLFEKFMENDFNAVVATYFRVNFKIYAVTDKILVISADLEMHSTADTSVRTSTDLYKMLQNVLVWFRRLQIKLDKFEKILEVSLIRFGNF